MIAAYTDSEDSATPLRPLQRREYEELFLIWDWTAL